MTRKLLIQSLAIVFVFAAAAGTAVAADYFPRDLREGDEGLDVYNLQVVLNAATSTRVADSGAGSPGNETTHFGARTKDALVRYQTLRGFAPADGVAAAATRAALNSALEKLAGTGVTAAAASAATSTAAPAASATPTVDPALLARLPAAIRERIQSDLANRSDSLPENFTTGSMVLFLNQTRGVEVGQTVKLVGYGFRAGAAYDIVNAATVKKIAAATATSSIAIQFKVPRLKAGSYSVYARGTEGQSNEVSFIVSGGSRPSVTSVTPDHVRPGDVVTVKGHGFGKDVTISTTLGDVASSTVTRKGGGSSLTFTSALGASLAGFTVAGLGTSTVPTQLYVTTSRGVSDPFLFYVEI